MTPADRSVRRDMNLFTPRDLLNLTDNPAELSAKDIARKFGVSEDRAREVRALACRSPEVLERQMGRLASPWYRPIGWDA